MPLPQVAAPRQAAYGHGPDWRLVGRAEAAFLMDMHPNRWDRYWSRHLELVRAVRQPRAEGKPAGRRKWLLGSIRKHIEEGCV